MTSAFSLHKHESRITNAVACFQVWPPDEHVSVLPAMFHFSCVWIPEGGSKASGNFFLWNLGRCSSL